MLADGHTKQEGESLLHLQTKTGMMAMTWNPNLSDAKMEKMKVPTGRFSLLKTIDRTRDDPKRSSVE